MTSDGPKSRPVIGVTGNARRFSPSWICIRLCVAMAGGQARRITVDNQPHVDELDGLIVSGGDDIHPSLFDAEELPSTSYDPERDEMEKRYIEKADELGKPVLGICRGYQLINVTFGGSLHLSVRHLRQITKNRWTIFPVKRALITRSSLLSQTLGKELTVVNSLHKQAIDRLSPTFDIVARDRDEIAQGIESRDKPIMGVQWHPEYLFYLPVQRRLFRWLVDSASQHAPESTGCCRD